MQALVTSLGALAFRMKELDDARDHPQAKLLVRELRDDVRAWRQAVQQQLRLWADDPEAAAQQGMIVEDRLMARLAKLEARMEETFQMAGEGELSDQDYENFYRLVGSYRGLSEEGINFVRNSSGINWSQWREARF